MQKAYWLVRFSALLFSFGRANECDVDWGRVSTTCSSGWLSHPDAKSIAMSHVSAATHPLPQVVLTVSNDDLDLCLCLGRVNTTCGSGWLCGKVCLGQTYCSRY